MSSLLFKKVIMISSDNVDYVPIPLIREGNVGVYDKQCDTPF